MEQSTHWVLSLTNKMITRYVTEEGGSAPAQEHTEAAGVQLTVNCTVVLTC